MSITEGYSYFLQELGYAAWTVAAGPEITDEDIVATEPSYQAKSDGSSFRALLILNGPASGWPRPHLNATRVAARSERSARARRRPDT